KIPAAASGSCYQRLRSRKMPLASLDHRQITDVVKRAGEGLQPLEHLCPVDARITRIRSGILSANPGGRTRSG
ncbi:hypothetical protein ACXEI2_004741, partial [Klebsiella pneumoniae]